MEEGTGAGSSEWVRKLIGANGGDNVADALGGKIGKIMVVGVFFDRIIERSRHDAFFKY